MQPEMKTPPEPVYEPIDEQGNPLPVTSFTELVNRSYPNGTQGTIAIDKDLPEAGAIAWADANIQQGEHGFVLSVNKLNITARSSVPTLALENLFKTLAHIEALGIKVHLEGAAKTPPTRQSTPTAPAESGKAAGAASTGNPPKPHPAAANAPKPTPQAPAQPAQPPAPAGATNRARIVKIVSKPLVGGKFVLEFHESGHPKYPDYATYKSGIAPDAALAILNESGYAFDLEMLNPVEAVAFDVNCELEWKYSEAVNSKGNHYKNFVRLYPVGG